MPSEGACGASGGSFTVAHLTTVDMSLRYLLLAQLRAVRDAGGTAIGISAPGPHVAALEAEGIRHIALHSSTRAADPLADVRAARELWKILRRESVDVLHTHNPKPGLYGRVVGRLAGVPIIVNTVHGLYATEDDPLPKRATVYALEGIASRWSDAELFQNPEDLALMRRLHLTRHASLLGNGIDLTWFDRARVGDAARRDLRAEIGATDDTVVVGCVGRLVREKGYPELFHAMAGLDPQRYRLVVAGADQPDKPDALDRATVHAARQRGVTFLGHREDVEHVYAALDVLALPSHREGFPRAPMEAAAMGVPSIVTDVRGCREVVEPGRTGIVVALHDPEGLRRAIAQLGEDPERRAAYGAAARAKAEHDFDDRAVVSRVFRAYLSAAMRRGIRLTTLEEQVAVRENHSP
ncbi:MAG: glycosyltransferase family 4 protein [Acidimicrobiia bacterium]